MKIEQFFTTENLLYAEKHGLNVSVNSGLMPECPARISAIFGALKLSTDRPNDHTVTYSELIDSCAYFRFGKYFFFPEQTNWPEDEMKKGFKIPDCKFLCDDGQNLYIVE